MPTEKKPATKKANTKKVAAAQAEATRQPATFEHRGLTFEIPHPAHFPLEVLLTDDELVATQLILGEDQWAAYLATRPDIEDFGRLTVAMAEAQGRDDDSGN
ncbi:hypothetical protein ABT160_04590 [Streptomyces sp. NPDC001941]|uniref:hypothetical protein n=1 Tax=Streptomyces sp. NPDC001941 TaxID=3154659 RepID=UPI0033199E82